MDWTVRGSNPVKGKTFSLLQNVQNYSMDAASTTAGV
jgi:hypothetical protein